jgi:acyl carrier protein
MSAPSKARLRELIAIELQLPVEEVQGGLSLRRDLGMDSVAALNIIFAAEEEFDVRVPETELGDVDDLDAVWRLIERHRPTGPPGTAISRSS